MIRENYVHIDNFLISGRKIRLYFVPCGKLKSYDVRKKSVCHLLRWNNCQHGFPTIKKTTKSCPLYIIKISSLFKLIKIFVYNVFSEIAISAWIIHEALDLMTIRKMKRHGKIQLWCTLMNSINGELMHYYGRWSSSVSIWATQTSSFIVDSRYVRNVLLVIFEIIIDNSSQ